LCEQKFKIKKSKLIKHLSLQKIVLNNLGLNEVIHPVLTNRAISVNYEQILAEITDTEPCVTVNPVSTFILLFSDNVRVLPLPKKYYF
jgi:hypothetical protein